jgi:ABC-2 type transport system permease protein
MLVPTLKKEVLLLKRDPRVLVRLVVMPLAFIAIFGMVFKGDRSKATLHAQPLAMWAHPAVKETERVRMALTGSKMYEVLESDSSDDVAKRVAAGTAVAGIVLPADFDPARGRPGTLVLDTDQSPQVLGQLQGSITSIVGRAYEGLGPPPVVLSVASARPRGREEAEASSFQLVVPGNAVLFGFFIALTCALSFAEERRTGTWRRLLASPVPQWVLLIAKLIPYIALGAIQVSLLFIVGAFGFGMKVNGSIPALVVLTIGVACCATTLGLAIAAFSTTEKQISSLGSVLILIMGLLGGCMLPRVLMPPLLQKIGLAVPHGWALDGYNTIIVRGGGFADVAKQLAAVYGFAAAFGLLGIRRFRFDLR